MSAHTPTTVETQGRPTIQVRLPDGWARAALSGVEAAFIGWALVMLPTVFAFATIASNPWLSSVTWSQAMGVGGDAWALVLGGTLDVGHLPEAVGAVATGPLDAADGAASAAEAVAGPLGLHIRLIPTLMSLIVVGVLRALLLSGRRFPASAHWFAVPGFAVTAVAFAAGTADHDLWHTTILGAVAIGMLAAAWAVINQRDTWAIVPKLPQWSVAGLRMALAATAAAFGLGLLAVLVAVLTAWDRIVGIHELLLTSTFAENFVTITAQFAFVPTAAMWALAWLAGPGFYLGTDALHTPSAAPVAPIPAVPLLGATPGIEPGVGVIVIPIACGVALGAWIWRREAERPLLDLLRTLLVMCVAMWLVMAGAAAASTAVLGTQRMSLIGPPVWETAFALTAEIGLVATMVALASHPTSVNWAKATWRQLPAGARREDATLDGITDATSTGRPTSSDEATATSVENVTLEQVDGGEALVETSELPPHLGGEADQANVNETEDATAEATAADASTADASTVDSSSADSSSADADAQAREGKE